MKYISLLLLFITGSTFAQLDRSQMPKPGPAPVINLGQPETFTLKNGLKVLVVENNKLPRVTARLVIDNPPTLEEKAGIQAMLSSLMGSGTTNISKDDFNEEVDFLGANINYGSSSAFASSLSKFFPRVVELMADGLLNPVFTQEEFDAEKAKLIEGIKSNDKNTPAITSLVSSALSYGTNHPYGQFETVESVEAVTLADVQNEYAKQFVPEKAYLVVVGDVSAKQVKKLVNKHFKKWKKANAPLLDIPTPKDAAFIQINFVDMPNSVQSEVTVQNLVDLKISDDDYFAVLLMNDILGGSFGSYLNMNLREDKGWTYGARSSVGASRYTSRFRASSQVRNEVTDSTVVEMLKEIDRIRMEDVDADKLEDVKKKYAGSFTLRLENPGTVANYALNIETNNLPKDFYETYLQRINDVNVEDVRRVANQYIRPENLRFVIGGKGSDIANALEKVTYNGQPIPVKYFNKVAEEVEKPEFSKPIPAGVTLETVYADYIKAIGGDKAKSVKNLVMSGSTAVQGMNLSVEYIVTNDGRMLNSLNMGSMPVMKSVVSKDKAYQEVQGQRMDMQGEQLTEMKKTAVVFAELSVPEGAALKNIQDVDGVDAYMVQVSESVTEFYAVETGLKLLTSTKAEQMGQSFTTSMKYDNYTEVDGVMFPSTWIQDTGMGMTLTIEYEDIKINQKLDDSKFN